MKLLWYVALGSAVGGVTRVLVGSSIQERFTGAYPMGTFIVNITGSLALGFLMRYALATPTVSAEMRALLTTGFCGGYTTFSTFSYESFTLGRADRFVSAAVYVAVSVTGGILAACAGYLLARRIA